MYNYFEEMKNDILDYINNEINFADYNDMDDLEESLRDDLWTVDSVTGNASGSYTFNRYLAKEYVLDNLDLLKEAYEEFDKKDTFADDFFDEEWEKMDVTIRCYYLGFVVAEVMELIANDFEAAHEIYLDDIA